MQKHGHRPMIEKPAYMLESVDNALRLVQLLRDVGAVRLSEAATELGVAPSTAHRLFAMLLYRGFAVQDENRRYHPGPAMGAGPARRGWTREFTERSRPHMEALASRCGETVNLVIRVGTQVRFLLSCESNEMLRVGDRQGQVLDAERTAGGKILLAELRKDVLAQLYLRPDDWSEADSVPGDRTMSAEQFDAFTRELAGCRTAGFAINLQQTEVGIAAFGMIVRNHAGDALGAISVAIPVLRYQNRLRGPLIAQMQSTVRSIEADIADIEF
ncbi:IclR family transcriptional regulator [Nocardia vinacea]|uniref:IclR family transcriptional regulator n=1 Tax=Nocardia vinacea TaxID=96468 RepID=UPI0002E4968D|nr:IclR family transcriptional regulator [Nocardia vinacea]